MFRGMYFNIKDGRLSCFGIGSIRYRNENKIVLLYSFVDSCVKSLNCSENDVGVITTRDLEESITVEFSTYLTLSILTIFSLGTYLLVNKKK